MNRIFNRSQKGFYPMTTKTEAKAKADALTILMATAEAVREAGRIPSGTLYAILMGRVDFEGYTRMIDILEGAGLIEKRSHELVWTGPALEVRP